jgi:hypothetical protein
MVSANAGNESGNDIATRQNSDEFLELQAAKNWLYDRARSVSRTQVWITVAVPLILAVLRAIYPADANLSDWAAIYAVVVLGFEPELDAWQERLRAQAALVQEVFDRRLFRWAWPVDALGPSPAPEDIQRWSSHYRPRMQEWKDWYPPRIAELPLPVARIACQRTNGWWDSDLRSEYATGLKWTGIGVIVSLLVVGVLRQQTLIEMAKLVALLAPVWRWLQRTTRRQFDIAGARRRLFAWSERLCHDWGQGKTSLEALEHGASDIQRETYEQRRRSPLVPSRLYRRSRERNEAIIRAAIDDICKAIPAKTET